MNKDFDMELFMSGILTGSKATQQRHLRQAQTMQAAIQQRWKKDNPWRWKTKHFLWFFSEHMKEHSEASQYYYHLTAKLILKKINKNRNLTTRALTSLRKTAKKPYYQPEVPPH